MTTKGSPIKRTQNYFKLHTVQSDLLLVVVITSAVLSLLLRIWEFNPRIPISYDGDGVLTLAAFRNMQLHNWYTFSNLVGYPYGQYLQDFPAVADGFCLGLSWLLVKVLRDPVLAFNAFFLLTYPISALGGYVGSHLLGLRRVTAVSTAVLYAFVPYHGLHGAPHLYLIMYPVLPVVVGLVVRELINPISFPGVKHAREAINLSQLFILTGVFAGASGLYYAFFSMGILVVGIVLSILQRGRIQAIWRMLVMLMAALVTVSIQFVPILWFQYVKGPNLDILKRGAFEVEYYSLRFIDLILPVPNHPLSALGEFTARNTSAYIPGEGTSYLGFIGAVGTVVLLLGLVARNGKWTMRPELGHLSQIFVILLLASVLGGFNQVLASLGFTQIRVWSRISIVLAFLALGAFGMVSDHLRSRWSVREGLFVTVAILITLFGIWDTNRMIPAQVYSTSSAAWHNDARLVENVSRAFGPGARVLQLPILKFPEQGPIERLGDYAQLRGTLHSKSLCWSYGAVIGRDADRTVVWQGLNTGKLIEAGRAQGFDALWLELRAYPDGGSVIAEELRAVLGDPVVSDDFRQVYVYRLRLDSALRLDCHQ